MKEFPIDKAYQFIEPGPVVLMTTSDKGKPNVMTMSWITCVDFVPQFVCIVSNGDYSFTALRKNKECVIAIPTVDMMATVIDIGNCSGQDVNKFEKFSLTPLPAKKIKAPLISECLANIECRVIDDSMADKYNLFILEGVKAWINPTRKEKRMFHAGGDGTFIVDGDKVDMKKRMTKFDR